ncbi:DUF418 domain-containing protein [Lysobacter auxotrophicus]|uniref:DUF418 domain-containing protein n=1 Tax=Lysobacter auxotrophicus TaxID=2992573 RepID=A0ABM8DBD7_9GAMM|nr:DUF418 domain-containing protein [Lysobacter auxotrophicus]BDU15860.1 DUF418 domain-containing protein [Lysobacter auxotrophicus]
MSGEIPPSKAAFSDAGKDARRRLGAAPHALIPVRHTGDGDAGFGVVTTQASSVQASSAQPRERASAAPIAASERLVSLDVLRGLALLGIGLMNVEYFSKPLRDMGQGLDTSQPPLDYAASWLVYVFVQGKFWILFSLLFGMGFALLDDRARVAGRDFRALYLRRAAGLLVIGLVHALLIWAGDILVSYALGAFVLLWFRDAEPARQGRWGAALYGVPALALLLMAGAMWLSPESASPSAASASGAARLAAEKAHRAEEIVAYSTGSWGDAVRVRARFFIDNLDETLVFEVFALGVFLMGAWLLRSGAIADPVAHARLHRILRSVALPVGVALALTSASVAVRFDWETDGARALLAMSLMLLASPLMSLGYLSWTLRALQTQAGARALGALAPAGRMALTNYLMQSIVGTLAFYGYGLGWWAQVPRRWELLGVAMLFALQVAGSRAWLSRFRFGPVEWLWRACTYGRFPPMRATPARSP